MCTPPQSDPQRAAHIDISQKCSQTTTGGHTAPTLKCPPQPGLSFGYRVAMVIPKQSIAGRYVEVVCTWYRYIPVYTWYRVCGFLVYLVCTLLNTSSSTQLFVQNTNLNY